MARNLMHRDDIAFEVGAAVLGLALVLAPWILGFLEVAAATWNAWIVGAAAIPAALAGAWRAAGWEHWVQAALGAWAIAAPWLLGFAATAAALNAHLAVGLLLLALALIALWWTSGNRPMSAA